VCGPGRAVLLGSWGKKDGTIEYMMHLVRPDQFFRDHAAVLAMPRIAASLVTDLKVYNRNHDFKMPWPTKKGETRVHNLITWVFTNHLVTTAFDPDATELTIAIHVPPVRASSGDV